MTDINYAPFKGDGRLKVEATLADRGVGMPMRVTNSQARQLIKSFLASGETAHSNQGAMVWVLKAWAREQKRDINITIHFVLGQRAGFTVTDPTR